MPTYRLFRFLTAALALFATASSAQAGAIYFSLTRADHTLQVTNIGNTTAFFPQALRLRADGQWEVLPLLHTGAAPTELPANQSTTFQWRPLPSAQENHPITAMQPVMMRFFDQAGAAFGQISFFNQPPPVSQPLEAAYQDGRMVIQAPPEPRVTWLLWGQGEGISPLRDPVRFAHHQPAAQRIAWTGKEKSRSFDLGAAQPPAMLLHETPQGMELQILASGRQGREQRAAWLDAHRGLFILSLASLIAALAALLIHDIRSRRHKEAA